MESLTIPAHLFEVVRFSKLSNNYSQLDEQFNKTA